MRQKSFKPLNKKNLRSTANHKPKKPAKKTRSRNSFFGLAGRLWREYLRHYRIYYPIIFTCMVVAGLATAALAKLIEPAVDQGLSRGLSGNNISVLWTTAGGFAIIALVRGFATFGQIIFLQRIGIQVVQELRSQMFRALQTRNLALFALEGTAKELSRFSNDVMVVIAAINNLMTSFGKDLSTLIFLLGVMFNYNWQLTLFCIVFYPLSLIPMRIIGNRVKQLSRAQQQEAGLMLAVLDDSLKGAKHVRAYGLEEWQNDRVKNSFLRNTKIAAKSSRVKAWVYPASDLVFAVIFSSTLLVGGYSIIGGDMTTGQFISYLLALIMVFQPIRAFANLNNSVNEAMPALTRIFDLIDTEQQKTALASGKTLKVTKGEIVFDNISFAYPDGRKVFENFSAKISGGKMVALVGSSGAGKSTLLQTIPRLYEINQGKIFIDGQDIAKCSLLSLRKNISVVSQEQGLFDVSIYDNILVGNLSASRAEVFAAAKHAEALHFINQLPNGFDTMAGELGAALSGGQKQRISLARAFLKNAPIILLDEVTSALDAKTEAALQKTWGQLLKGRTALIIAHRLATVKRADIILVLDKGKVVEIGNHDQLMQQSGLYAKLAAQQFSA